MTINGFIDFDEHEKAFNLLVRLVESMIESDMDEDDIFRSVELITYYFAKIITYSTNSLKNRIYNWIYNFVKANGGCFFIADEYFCPFLDGRMIYHADSYYTGYDDYKRVLSYYKN